MATQCWTWTNGTVGSYTGGYINANGNPTNYVPATGDGQNIYFQNGNASVFGDAFGSPNYRETDGTLWSPFIGNFNNPMILTICNSSDVGGPSVGIYWNRQSLPSLVATLQPGEQRSFSFTLSGVSPPITLPIVGSATPCTVCCVHGKTLIRTTNGIKPIEEIKENDIVFDKDENEVKVIYNIKYLPQTQFIKISKNALSNNLPENDLYIRKGHPVIINGEEVECQNLVNGVTIIEHTFDHMSNVYSLCTENRVGVMMEGIVVMTWGQKDWEEYVENINIFWTKQ